MGCLCVMSVQSCTPTSRLDFALSQAGENREELQNVLDYYQGDSMKLKAALFLIENMPYRYGFEGKDLENLYLHYRSASISKLSPKGVTDSLSMRSKSFGRYELKAVSDISRVSSEYLIDHIDTAFEIWRKQPWGKKIDFDTFCHHILPYRVGNEKLRPWIREIHDKFNPLLDSIRATPDSADIIKVAEALIANLQKIKRNYGHGLPSGLTIGPDNTRWFAGDCREFADIQTYIMRAVGLPGGCDKMPMSGNYFLPHFWNYVIDENGGTHYCSILFKTPLTEPSSDYPGSKGKVMREKFELNEEYFHLHDECSNLNNVDPRFRFFTDEDVTSLYSPARIYTVTVPLKDCYDAPRHGEYVYACLSSHLDWVPVDAALKTDDCIKIRNVDGGIVMRLAVYRDNRLQFLCNPFLIGRHDGKISFYTPEAKNETACLLYKFDDIFRERFSVGMLGGVMEGSNFLDFTRKDTLHIIQTAPERLYTRVRSSSGKSYKYVRYFGPEGGKCYASEVSFYGHTPGHNGNELLTGVCIGTPNLHSDNKYPHTNVVDGNPYTSFVYEKESGGWAGLELKRPMIVDSVVYSPRNRRNFIESGDDYELFYCDREWKSLGHKVADSDSILFDVPQGALLYLKNHSRGNQERIFEYENGKQIFY